MEGKQEKKRKENGLRERERERYIYIGGATHFVPRRSAVVRVNSNDQLICHLVPASKQG
jgi:hypothetical protein